jgi:hypothetical protein
VCLRILGNHESFIRGAAMADAFNEAFRACSPMLSTLAKASDPDAQTTVRTWWVLCMGSHLAECKSAATNFKDAAARQNLPENLRPEDTPSAVRLPALSVAVPRTYSILDPVILALTCPVLVVSPALHAPVSHWQSACL